MHAPVSVISAEGKRDFPLPEPKHPTRFQHGTGMVYEIQAVRECLLKGIVFMYISEFVVKTTIPHNLILTSYQASLLTGGPDMNQ